MLPKKTNKNHTVEPSISLLECSNRTLSLEIASNVISNKNKTSIKTPNALKFYYGWSFGKPNFSRKLKFFIKTLGSNDVYDVDLL